MTIRTIGIIIHGATGRIASTQHLANALVPIRDEGGLPAGSDVIVPRLLLVGRNADKLAALAAQHKVEWTTDLDAALADPDYSVLLEAAATHQRPDALEKAIAAGKHIYAEKPVALSAERGRAILAAAQARGVKHGAVEDKLGLPGLAKLAKLAASDFFGRVTGFRIDFGWWVFDGTEIPSQRPSWNYRRATGGGLILDMYPHWRYVIENTLGPIRRLVTQLSTAQPERIDEQGRRYAVDVEDNATTLIELESGATGTILSSWATRVRRSRSTAPVPRSSRACTAAGHSPTRRRRAPRISASPRTPTSTTAPTGARSQIPARSRTPTGSAGRISSATSQPVRRCRPISPPASATWRSPKPATAA